LGSLSLPQAEAALLAALSDPDRKYAPPSSKLWQVLRPALLCPKLSLLSAIWIPKYAYKLWRLFDIGLILPKRYIHRLNPFSPIPTRRFAPVPPWPFCKLALIPRP